MYLKQAYNNLIKKYDFEQFIYSNDAKRLNTIIRLAINNFMNTHSRVAIYGNGLHTSMLMVDFSFELRDVKHIIDNYNEDIDISNGFTIIKESEIELYKIDGVILSSYHFKEEFKQSLIAHHGNIDYLDIYSELEDSGIVLTTGYYDLNHPHSRYQAIIQIQDNLKAETDYWELIKRYIQIKDIQSAHEYARQLYATFPTKQAREFLSDIEKLISCFHETVKEIGANNVLMLCLDGMPRDGLYEGGMPGLFQVCQTKGCIYTNAYSYSTYTYESLFPAYSENNDLRTEYYFKDSIKECECRFIQVAREQDRKIYFYTDGYQYVDSDIITLREDCRCASEKLWDFVLDAAQEQNGLFYIHILYESHHPYRNPLIKGGILQHGPFILYEWGSGGNTELEVDYEAQFNSSLCYLDKQLTSFLKNLNCGVMLYADHGIFLVPKGTFLMDVRKTLFAADEERIRIPMVLFSDKIENKSDNRLISLMEFNNIMVSLLKREGYCYTGKNHIKIGRSAIFGGVTNHVCRERGADLEALAFEGFIFEIGYKLIVYSNKVVELYNLNDEIIDDDELKQKLFDEITSQITVY